MVLVFRVTIEPSAKVTLRCWPTAVAKVCNSLPCCSHIAPTATAASAAAASHQRRGWCNRGGFTVLVNVAIFSSRLASASPSRVLHPAESAAAARRWRGSWRSHASNACRSAAATAAESMRQTHTAASSSMSVRVRSFTISLIHRLQRPATHAAHPLHLSARLHRAVRRREDSRGSESVPSPHASRSCCAKRRVPPQFHRGTADTLFAIRTHAGTAAAADPPPRRRTRIGGAHRSAHPREPQRNRRLAAPNPLRCRLPGIFGVEPAPPPYYGQCEIATRAASRPLRFGKGRRPERKSLGPSPRCLPPRK